MGEVVGKLTADQLMACRMGLDLISRLSFDLGMAKRGHQHLWNELADQYGFAGKKIQLDYETGAITTQETVIDG